MEGAETPDVESAAKHDYLKVAIDFAECMIEHGRDGFVFDVGDTTVEIFFSPNEDAVGRILDVLEEAQESVEFMIFAFTKDQIGSMFISKHQSFTHYNACCDPDIADEVQSLRLPHNRATVYDNRDAYVATITDTDGDIRVEIGGRPLFIEIVN